MKQGTPEDKYQEVVVELEGPYGLSLNNRFCHIKTATERNAYMDGVVEVLKEFVQIDPEIKMVTLRDDDIAGSYDLELTVQIGKLVFVTKLNPKKQAFWAETLAHNLVRCAADWEGPA